MKSERNTSSELNATIEKYRREMLASYQRKSLPDDDTTPLIETSISHQPPIPYTYPNIEDLSAIKEQPVTQNRPVEYALDYDFEDECSPSPSMLRPVKQLKKEVLSSMPAPLSSPAMLQVMVVTGKSSAPVVGARVVVTRAGASSQKVHKSVQTDGKGSTPVISMPNCEPPAPCTIEVNASGYCSARYSGIPLYGGLTAIQQIDLIPLPAGQKSELLILFDETPAQP